MKHWKTINAACREVRVPVRERELRSLAAATWLSSAILCRSTHAHRVLLIKQAVRNFVVLHLLQPRRVLLQDVRDAGKLGLKLDPARDGRKALRALERGLACNWGHCDGS